MAMSENLVLQKIEPLIQIRGARVILDADLARIYGVTTKRLDEQVKLNADRFPDDFAFELSKEEWGTLRSQSVTSKSHGGQNAINGSSGDSNGGRRYQPHAFTEHGGVFQTRIDAIKTGHDLPVVGGGRRLQKLLPRHRC